MSEASKESSTKLCGICEENISKYCCPRCDVFYCSLDCYKSEKHSECSEDFYRDCINEELASHNVDEESKHKMIDILKRMHEETTEDLENIPENEELDSDDDEGIDLEERIKDLNLDDADALWNALTADEKNEFQALLVQGDVESIIPQWEPWWMYRKQDKLVEEVSELNKEEEEAEKKCPQVKPAPKINSLTKVQPSSVIKFNITNVLASYAFIMRYFNVEVEPVEAVAYLLDICTNLAANANFDEPATAVESVAQKCLQSEIIETDEASLDVMKYDVYLILNGPSEQNKSFYCNAALSHLSDLLTTARNSCKTKNEDKKSKNASTFSKKFPDHNLGEWNSLDVSKIKKIIKKVEYYLSYVQSCSMDFDL